MMLENATTTELMKYENNYKALNLITTTLGRNLYDCISHLESAHAVWEKLYNTFEGTSEIKLTRKDTYNRQYQTFSQKPSESLDDCFARFESIVSSYVLVVHLPVMTMNVLNNYCMLLMIMFGV
jgi:nucleoid-associated protein YejK